MIAFLILAIGSAIFITSHYVNGEQIRPEHPKRICAAEFGIKRLRNRMRDGKLIENFYDRTENFEEKDIQKEFKQYIVTQHRKFSKKSVPPNERALHGNSAIYLLKLPENLPTEYPVIIAISKVLILPDCEITPEATPIPTIPENEDGILWVLDGTNISFFSVNFENFRKKIPKLDDPPDFYHYGPGGVP